MDIQQKRRDQYAQDQLDLQNFFVPNLNFSQNFNQQNQQNIEEPDEIPNHEQPEEYDDQEYDDQEYEEPEYGDQEDNNNQAYNEELNKQADVHIKSMETMQKQHSEEIEKLVRTHQMQIANIKEKNNSEISRIIEEGTKNVQNAYAQMEKNVVDATLTAVLIAEHQQNETKIYQQAQELAKQENQQMSTQKEEDYRIAKEELQKLKTEQEQLKRYQSIEAGKREFLIQTKHQQYLETQLIMVTSNIEKSLQQYDETNMRINNANKYTMTPYDINKLKRQAETIKQSIPQQRENQTITTTNIIKTKQNIINIQKMQKDTAAEIKYHESATKYRSDMLYSQQANIQKTQTIYDDKAIPPERSSLIDYKNDEMENQEMGLDELLGEESDEQMEESKIPLKNVKQPIRRDQTLMQLNRNFVRTNYNTNKRILKNWTAQQSKLTAWFNSEHVQELLTILAEHNDIWNLYTFQLYTHRRVLAFDKYTCFAKYWTTKYSYTSIITQIGYKWETKTNENDLEIQIDNFTFSKAVIDQPYLEANYSATTNENLYIKRERNQNPDMENLQFITAKWKHELTKPRAHTPYTRDTKNSDKLQIEEYLRGHNKSTNIDINTYKSLELLFKEDVQHQILETWLIQQSNDLLGANIYVDFADIVFQTTFFERVRSIYTIVNQNQYALELGCGKGRIYQNILRHHYRYIDLLDIQYISVANIIEQRQMYKDQTKIRQKTSNIGIITRRIADKVQNLKEYTELFEYDLIYANYMLCYLKIQEIEEHLQLIHNILTFGGIYIIKEIVHSEQAIFIDKSQGALLRRSLFYEILFENANFNILESEILDINGLWPQKIWALRPKEQRNQKYQYGQQETLRKQQESKGKNYVITTQLQDIYIRGQLNTNIQSSLNRYLTVIKPIEFPIDLKDFQKFMVPNKPNQKFIPASRRNPPKRKTVIDEDIPEDIEQSQELYTQQGFKDMEKWMETFDHNTQQQNNHIIQVINKADVADTDKSNRIREIEYEKSQQQKIPEELIDLIIDQDMSQ